MVSAWLVSAVMVSVLVLVASDPCVPPGDVLVGSTGYFSSPNFPNNSATNSNCSWTITVPAGRIIKVTFVSFALDPSHNTNCLGGSGVPHVSITNVASDDGAAEFKICGVRLPHPVYSVGNSIQVRLITGADSYQGFNASYEALDEKLLCPNGVTLTERSGVITSPYYPRKHPDNLNCTWKITAPQGSHVKLQFDKINIHDCNDPACPCDYLQIHDGFSENRNGKERICGAPRRSIIFYSIRETLEVQFVSDGTWSKLFEGFKATYTLLRYTPPIFPAEAIPLTGKGTLSSPNYPLNYYPASTNSSWIITVPPDKLVKLVFTELALGSCQVDCSSGDCTYVELYDGPSANYSSLGRLCSGSSLKEVLSTGNQMFVNFRSGFSLDWGFEAQYEPMNPPEPTCNQTGGPYGLVTVTDDEAELRLMGKECLSNGNRVSYIQIILIQRKNKDQDIGSSTDEAYAADKDYIIAEFDYGNKETFSIGDGKNYSKTGGSREYYNGKLKSNTYYAAFQRSFDDSGSYDSEKFVKFKTTEKTTEKFVDFKTTEKPTEKPTDKPTDKPKISSTLFIVVVLVVALLCAIIGAVSGLCYAKRKWKLVPVNSEKEMENIIPDKMPATKSDTSF